MATAVLGGWAALCVLASVGILANPTNSSYIGSFILAITMAVFSVIAAIEVRRFFLRQGRYGDDSARVKKLLTRLLLLVALFFVIFFVLAYIYTVLNRLQT